MFTDRSDALGKRKLKRDPLVVSNMPINETNGVGFHVLEAGLLVFFTMEQDCSALQLLSLNFSNLCPESGVQRTPNQLDDSALRWNLMRWNALS